MANKLNFKEGLIYEDELWTPQVLLKANRVLATNIYHYNYLQRENTITNSGVNQVKVDSLFYVSKQLIKLTECKQNQELKDCLWFRSCIIYNSANKFALKIEGGYKPPFYINWHDLSNAKLTFNCFNKCIGLLSYTKNKRRFLRMLYKLMSGLK